MTKPANRVEGCPVALVTGSSRGLGREVALRFARGGWNVVVNCVRSMDKANAVVEEIRALGAKALAVQADIADRSTHAALLDAATGRWGRLDCLVNNAAIVRDVSVVRVTPELWDEIVGVDLLGPIHLARRAAELMRPGSSIVNVASICGLWGCAAESAYSAAKGALIGFTEGVAAEFAERGIHINALAPGYMMTDMGSDSPTAVEVARAQHPMGVLCDPKAAAEFIFQLTDRRTVAGQMFNLDGRIR